MTTANGRHPVFSGRHLKCVDHFLSLSSYHEVNGHLCVRKKISISVQFDEATPVEVYIFKRGLSQNKVDFCHNFFY